MKIPKIDCSIIVTCYQKESYLNECLESVKRQTRQPREVILVHDACDEPMAHAIATTIILPKNVGVCKARDIGFNYSSGKLILFLDADDVISPDYLEKMALVMSKNTDIVYPDLYVWQGKESYLSIPPKTISMKYLKRKSKIPVPITSMMKREIYEELGGFKEMPVLEDLDFFVRALCKGYTMKRASTLLWYRRYEGTRNNVDLETREGVLAKILAQTNA